MNFTVFDPYTIIMFLNFLRVGIIVKATWTHKKFCTDSSPRYKRSFLLKIPNAANDPGSIYPRVLDFSSLYCLSCQCLSVYQKAVATPISYLLCCQLRACNHIVTYYFSFNKVLKWIGYGPRPARVNSEYLWFCRIFWTFWYCHRGNWWMRSAIWR